MFRCRLHVAENVMYLQPFVTLQLAQNLSLLCIFQRAGKGIERWDKLKGIYYYWQPRRYLRQCYARLGRCTELDRKKVIFNKQSKLSQWHSLWEGGCAAPNLPSLPRSYIAETKESATSAPLVLAWSWCNKTLGDIECCVVWFLQMDSFAWKKMRVDTSWRRAPPSANGQAPNTRNTGSATHSGVPRTVSPGRNISST